MNTPDAVPVALDTWPRREAYTFFSGLSDPSYSVTVTADVTALHTYTKRRGLSFYYALVWLCTQSINHTTAFRYAIRNGQPVLLARREPSFTDLHPGAEQFHIVTMPAGDALDDFCRAARAKSRAQTEFLCAAAESDALIYFSCLPWVSLTALTNERDFDADDAIPRIVWGKYHREGERDVLGLALEVNHRLIDGLHIGRFVQDLQQRIDALVAQLKEANPDIEISGQAVEGESPTRALIDYSKGFGTLVLGTRTTSALGRALFGSLTHSVLMNLTIPTIVVSQP